MITNQWFLVCFREELQQSAIVKRKIVGEEVVAFMDENGQAAVLQDRCCHRNVHLSLGYVQNGRIKCGYHGWEFDARGKCQHIPSLSPEENIPRAACIKSYPVRLSHKAIWAYFGREENMHNADIPPFKELDYWPIAYNYHVVKANLKLVAESLFDSHHINHVHRNSIKTMMGNLYNEKTDYHLETAEKSLAGWYLRDNESTFFEKLYFGFEPKIKAAFAYWFPHSSMLHLYFPKHFTMPEREMVIYEHFYEIDEDNIMMIQITAWKNIFSFSNWFANWFMLKKSLTIVEEDIKFLESNKYWHQKQHLNDLLIKPDELTFAFTKLWNKNTTKNAAQTDTVEAE